MTQRWYSVRTVQKLKVAAENAERNFKEMRDMYDVLVESNREAELKADQYYKYWQDEMGKVADLEIKLGIRKSYQDGQATKAADVKQSAAARAHQELHKVKPDEDNTRLLHRAIGNAQGILAAALDANDGYAAPISLYPDEERADREKHPIRHYKENF